MKKLISFFTVLVIALVTLTSCDEDYMISYDLKGTWEGNLRIENDYNGKIYEITKTYIEFIPYENNRTKGTGYWVDYYSNAPWDKWANHIEWSVNNGIIWIHFVEDRTNIEIHDFSLSNNYFKGWFYDDDRTICNFNMYHTSKGNWDSYNHWGYSYTDAYYDGYYDGYYNTWSKSTRSSNDSININNEQPVRRIVKKTTNN